MERNYLQTKKVEIEKYVADDGKIFKNPDQYQQYERKKIESQLNVIETSKNLVIFYH